MSFLNCFYLVCFISSVLFIIEDTICGGPKETIAKIITKFTVTPAIIYFTLPAVKQLIQYLSN